MHWVRTAAEHRAIFLQTYRAATDRVRELVAGRTPGAWGVVIDADETVFDNSEYQRRLALRGASFDNDTWNDWVREVAADSLPGAAAFRTGLPALDIVMYVGDNIRDFPGMTQPMRDAAGSAFDGFGRSWFILPNPMYGSWERNAVR